MCEGVTLVFNVFFIIMLAFNYPDKNTLRLNLVLTIGINGPWTLTCLRRYIVSPTDTLTRNFCIVYDTIITKPFLRNHILLLTFSNLGFQNSAYFTLMLLDIVNNSPLLMDMVLAVAAPMPKLGLVLYSIVVVSVIYGT